MKYPRLSPYKICEGVHAVGGVRRSHIFDSAVYAVLGPTGTVLIDCGSQYGFEYKEKNLRKIGSRMDDVALVIGTHCHYDHLGGAAELKRRNPKVRLAMHEADRAAVENGDPDLTCSGWMFDDCFEPAAVDETLKGGETVSAAGLDFEIISTPGHSPGSITVVCRVGGKKIVFAGDSYVPSCPRVGYDYDELMETYERLLELDSDFICPGHLGHLFSFPVTQAITGALPAPIVRAFININPMMKVVATLSSHFYENSTYANPFMQRIKEL
jgi:glyoxylase-like metal-dependent hydrolase (beta-lactamase superfamily II)